MSRISILLIVACAFCLGSCSLIGNAVKYNETAKEFVESAIKEDYDKCVSLFALNRPEAKNISTDTLKKGIAGFRNNIVTNLGTELDYKFISASKKFSTSDEGPGGLTEVKIQVSNNEVFSELVVMFDDESGKVFTIRASATQPIPPMTTFWLFGILCLCVAAFNIYMIVRIRRSNRQKKWMKYLAVVALNIPTISFKAGSGIFISSAFQIMMGVSFNLGGYANSAWEFGLPLGGLYWLWRLTAKPRIDEPIAEPVTDALDQSITETP